MGKSPEAAIFLPKAPVLPAASRAYTLDGGEAYEKQQHRKPLLHESGGVRRDRPAAAGDRRGGRRRRGLRPRAAGAGTRAGHPDARDPRRAGTRSVRRRSRSRKQSRNPRRNRNQDPLTPHRSSPPRRRTGSGSPEPAATRRTSRRCSCSRAASIFSRTGRPS